jgi:hypothetical protein
MSDIKRILNELIAARFETMTPNELATELASLPLADLVRVYASGVLDSEVPQPPRLSAVARRDTPTQGEPVTLKAAFMRALHEAERPLTSNDIVERVIAIRPSSPEGSIRSEISRARKLGVVKLQGDPRGGTYTLNASRSTIRPTVTGQSPRTANG